MTILIDGDILVYRMGFALEKEEEDLVPAWVGGFINDLVAQVVEVLELREEPKVQCFISGEGKSNFRYSLYDLYKANRVQPKPKYYGLIRSYLEKVEEALVSQGQEADDDIGIIAHREQGEAIIVSLDKDLLQIPSYNYNFVKKKVTRVTRDSAQKFFYKQLLMGDAADNIPGVDKIGDVKSDKILDGLEWEVDMFWAMLDQYLQSPSNDKKTLEEVLAEVLRNGQLLKIRQVENEMWDFPTDPWAVDLTERRKQLIEGRKKKK